MEYTYGQKDVQEGCAGLRKSGVGGTKNCHHQLIHCKYSEIILGRVTSKVSGINECLITIKYVIFDILHIFYCVI